MSEKKITFLGTLDDTQINQAIAGITLKMKALQNTASLPQLTNLNNLSAQGLPGMNANTQNATNQAYNNSQVNAKREYADQMIQLNKIGDSHAKITKELAIQLEQRKTMLSVTKEAAKLDEEILQNKKELGETERALGAQTRITVAAAAGLPKPANPGSGGGGINSDMLGKMAGSLSSGNISGAVVAAGASAAIVGAIAGAITLAMKTFSTLSYNPIQSASDRGSAVQGVYGREVDAMFSGRGGLEASYAPEKMKALDAAKGNKASNQMWANFSMNGLMSNLGIQSAIDARNSGLARKTSDDYGTALEGYKNQDPLSRNTRESYYANAQANLGFQRQTGLNYNSFYGQGGYQDSAINAGFDPRQAMSMSSAILGAGGSTSSAGGGNAVLALQAQRNFNLTNAGSMLGKIGGNNGSEADNKESLIRILAAGTKLGFDGSHYVEESRKFNDIVTDIISKSGSGSSSDAERNANRFAKFVADPTTSKGIEAAKNAYDAYQDSSGETTGRQGVIRASGFFKKFGKVDTTVRNNLFNLHENQLTTEDPDVKLAAIQQGVSPQSILDTIKGINTDASTGGLRGLQRNINERDSLIKANYGEMSPEKRKETLRKLEVLNLKVTSGRRFVQAKQLSGKDATAYSGGLDGDNSYGPGSPMSLTSDRLGSTADTGKMEDKNANVDAEAAREMLSSFRDAKDILVPATEAMKAYNDQIERNIKLTTNGGGDLRPDYGKLPNGDALEAESHTMGASIQYVKSLLSPKVQPQSGVPTKK